MSSVHHPLAFIYAGLRVRQRGSSMLQITTSGCRGQLAIVKTALAFALILAGCAVPTSERTVPVPQASPFSSSDPGSAQDGSGGLIGEWEGTTVVACLGLLMAGRCNARNNISFTLLPREGSDLVGSYTCSYGNQTCLRQNTDRKIPRVKRQGNRI